MFTAAELILLNKIELPPHLRFDVVRCVAYAHEINPDAGLGANRGRYGRVVRMA